MPLLALAGRYRDWAERRARKKQQREDVAKVIAKLFAETQAATVGAEEPVNGAAETRPKGPAKMASNGAAAADDHAECSAKQPVEDPPHRAYQNYDPIPAATVLEDGPAWRGRTHWSDSDSLREAHACYRCRLVSLWCDGKKPCLICRKDGKDRMCGYEHDGPTPPMSMSLPRAPLTWPKSPLPALKLPMAPDNPPSQALPGLENMLLRSMDSASGRFPCQSCQEKGLDCNCNERCQHCAKAHVDCIYVDDHLRKSPDPSMRAINRNSGQDNQPRSLTKEEFEAFNFPFGQPALRVKRNDLHAERNGNTGRTKLSWIDPSLPPFENQDVAADQCEGPFRAMLNAGIGELGKGPEKGKGPIDSNVPHPRDGVSGNSTTEARDSQPSKDLDPEKTWESEEAKELSKTIGSDGRTAFITPDQIVTCRKLWAIYTELVEKSRSRGMDEVASSSVTSSPHLPLASALDKDPYRDPTLKSAFLFEKANSKSTPVASQEESPGIQKQCHKDACLPRTDSGISFSDTHSRLPVQAGPSGTRRGSRQHTPASTTPSPDIQTDASKSVTSLRHTPLKRVLAENCASSEGATRRSSPTASLEKPPGIEQSTVFSADSAESSLSSIVPQITETYQPPSRTPHNVIPGIKVSLTKPGQAKASSRSEANSVGEAAPNNHGIQCLNRIGNASVATGANGSGCQSSTRNDAGSAPGRSIGEFGVFRIRQLTTCLCTDPNDPFYTMSGSPDADAAGSAALDNATATDEGGTATAASQTHPDDAEGQHADDGRAPQDVPEELPSAGLHSEIAQGRSRDEDLSIWSRQKAAE